jgi:hypothetical protein
MTSDRLAEAVRAQVAIGRLLPLGGPADDAWITEQAVAGVLRAAAARIGGVRIGEVRVGSDLRVDASFEATADRPLPVTAELLRGVLWEAAHQGLGLRVVAVDLTVAGLLNEAPEPPEPAAPAEPVPALPDGEPGPVPGARLTARLGGVGSEAYVQIAVTAGHRALDVARAVGAVLAPRMALVTDVE